MDTHVLSFKISVQNPSVRLSAMSVIGEEKTFINREHEIQETYNTV